MLDFIASLLFLSVVIAIPTYGFYRKIDLMHFFSEGAHSGLETLKRLLPFLLGMFTAIRMLRASGFFDTMASWMAPLFTRLGVPSELLSLMLIRPFSGAASNAILVDILKEHGGNSLLGMMAATIMGSTETTFYVISFYFAAVGVKKIRYALWTSLLADVSGMLAAAYLVPWLFS